jgi:hypothetical protein
MEVGTAPGRPGAVLIRMEIGGAYIVPMPPFDFCIPTTGTNVPAGAEWLREIKYDGYPLLVSSATAVVSG